MPPSRRPATEARGGRRRGHDVGRMPVCVRLLVACGRSTSTWRDRAEARLDRADEAAAQSGPSRVDRRAAVRDPGDRDAASHTTPDHRLRGGSRRDRGRRECLSIRRDRADGRQLPPRRRRHQCAGARRPVPTSASSMSASLATSTPPAARPHSSRGGFGAGTRNMTKGPAMSEDELASALDIGLDIADAAAEDGVAVHRLRRHGYRQHDGGERDDGGNSRGAADEVTGPGTGIDSEMLAHKVDVVRRALATNQPGRDPLAVLRTIGGSKSPRSPAPTSARRRIAWRSSATASSPLPQRSSPRRSARRFSTTGLLATARPNPATRCSLRFLRQQPLLRSRDAARRGHRRGARDARLRRRRRSDERDGHLRQRRFRARATRGAGPVR